jgi:hypothetical protein
MSQYLTNQALPLQHRLHKHTSLLFALNNAMQNRSIPHDNGRDLHRRHTTKDARSQDSSHDDDGGLYGDEGRASKEGG